MVKIVVAWEREHLTDWVWVLWSFPGQGSAGYLVWQCFWDYVNPGICDQKKGGMDLGQQKCVLPINPDCEDCSEGDAESPTVPLFLGWPWNIRARHRWDAQTCDNLEWYLRTLTTTPCPHGWRLSTSRAGAHVCLFFLWWTLQRAFQWIDTLPDRIQRTPYYGYTCL